MTGTITPFADPAATTGTANVADPCLGRLRDLTGVVVTEWPDDCPPSPPPIRAEDAAAASLHLAASVMGSGMSLLPA